MHPDRRTVVTKMPDLLAHALFAYAIGTALSWRYEWVRRPHVTAVMAGAFVPDLAKAGLVVESSTIQRALGFPFDWFGLHTVGGVVLTIMLGVSLVVVGERKRTALLLGLGAGSHLLADALLLTPSGRSAPLLWPLTGYAPPTPGLYLSTEPEPTVVAAMLAFVVWAVTRDRSADRPS